MDLLLNSVLFSKFIIPNILVIQVVLPLLVAVLVFLIKNRTISWLVTTATIFAVFATALLTTYLFLLLDGKTFAGITTYYLGSWTIRGVGIVYKSSSALSHIVAILATFSAFMAMIWGRSFINKETGEKFHYFNTAFLVALSGLLGMLFTDDLFNLFVFLEISSLATYTILALNQKNNKCYISSLNYLIIGTVAATLYVFGVGILYASTGHLNFIEIARSLNSMDVARSHYLAFGLIFAGLLMKIGIFPLHAWMAQVYKNSPTVASMFLASVATKVIVFIIVKIFVLLKVLNIAILPINSFSLFSALLLTFGAVSALVGSYLALKSNDFAQMLALSSVGQMGYILIALAVGTKIAFYAAVIHVLNHGIIKLSLFMTRANIIHASGLYTFKDIKEKGFYNAFIFFGLFVSGLSIIGVPGTAGFVSKYYLVLSILAAKHISFVTGVILIATILASSLLAVAYVWKAVESMWFNERTFTKTNANYQKSSISMNIGYYFVVSLNVLLGFAIVILWFYIG